MDFLKNKKILVVGAHSDDEVLGVGGTILRAKSLGSIVDVLILTDSVSTQYQGHTSMGKQRTSALEKCCEKLSVNRFFQLNLPDMKLDQISHVQLNSAIHKILTNGGYEVVFVHHDGDINRDHQLAVQSVMVCVRPAPGQTVKTVLSYYTPSSSEWGGYDRRHIFCPNIFIDIDDFLEQKLNALSSYKSELRVFPHPRSIENVRNMASYFGSQVGMRSAEAFQLLRHIEKF